MRPKNNPNKKCCYTCSVSSDLTQCGREMRKKELTGRRHSQPNIKCNVSYLIWNKYILRRKFGLNLALFVWRWFNCLIIENYALMNH